MRGSTSYLTARSTYDSKYEKDLNYYLDDLTHKLHEHPDATKGKSYIGTYETKRTIVSRPGQPVDKKSPEWQEWYKNEVVLAPHVASPSAARRARSTTPSRNVNSSAYKSSYSSTVHRERSKSPATSRPRSTSPDTLYLGTSPMVNRWEQQIRWESESALKAHHEMHMRNHRATTPSTRPASRPSSRASSRPVTPIHMPNPDSRAASPAPSYSKASLDAQFSRMVQKEQEYYRFRDHEHGKPLPGDHDYMGQSWSEGLNRAGTGAKSSGWDSYLAEMYKNKKKDNRNSADVKNWEKYLAEIYKNRRPPPRTPSPPPKRRPRSVPPRPAPTPEIKAIPKIETPRSRPVTPMMLPELRVMEPPHAPPPLGSLRRRGKREEEEPWYGPPCELCHKPIEERRCMLAENMKFHCWHFVCTFCFKTLRENDFTINSEDMKPYCLDCYKKTLPGYP